jgi:transcriptional regulator
MYEPAHFKVEDRATLLAVIRAHPLAQLITSGQGGLMANAIPFVVSERGGDVVLRAHLARPNPQWRTLQEGAEALVVFQSVEGYVTPSWYETKRETGKVVPTWNYIVVQARGTVRIDDSAPWLRDQIDALTSQQEDSVGSAWKVGDAPEPFVTAQMRGIVGVEMTVTALNGKFKLSQNRSEADKRGVVEGLAEQESPNAHTLAELVRRFGNIG